MIDDYFEEEVDIPSRKKVKGMYFEFLKDFREYLIEYMRESVVELKIAEVSVNEELKLFDGFPQGKAKIKNQGDNPCFISTSGSHGYRLDPEETVEFFVNYPVTVTTVSGMTTLGFIKS